MFFVFFSPVSKSNHYFICAKRIWLCLKTAGPFKRWTQSLTDKSLNIFFSASGIKPTQLQPACCHHESRLEIYIISLVVHWISHQSENRFTMPKQEALVICTERCIKVLTVQARGSPSPQAHTSTYICHRGNRTFAFVQESCNTHLVHEPSQINCAEPASFFFLLATQKEMCKILPFITTHREIWGDSLRRLVVVMVVLKPIVSTRHQTFPPFLSGVNILTMQTATGPNPDTDLCRKIGSRLIRAVGKLSLTPPHSSLLLTVANSFPVPEGIRRADAITRLLITIVGETWRRKPLHIFSSVFYSNNVQCGQKMASNWMLLTSLYFLKLAK